MIWNDSPAMTGTSKSKLVGICWPTLDAEFTCLVLIKGGFLFWDMARLLLRLPLVGEGGGYDTPRCVGLNKWLTFLPLGTDKVFWFRFKLKLPTLGEPKVRFGRLWPRLPYGWTESVLGVLWRRRFLKEFFCDTGLLSGGKGWTPSSLDIEPVLLSFSTETPLDWLLTEPTEDWSFISTEPLQTKE